MEAGGGWRGLAKDFQGKFDRIESEGKSGRCRRRKSNREGGCGVVKGLIERWKKRAGTKPAAAVVPAVPGARAKKHVVYLSGPMTGIKSYNYQAFHGAERRVRALGHDVINPARTGELDTKHLARPDWHDYMASAVRRMRDATAIHYLPGWEKSYGARMEAIVAEKKRLVRIP